MSSAIDTEITHAVEVLHNAFSEKLKGWLIGQYPTLPDPMVDHDDVVSEAFAAFLKSELQKSETGDQYKWPERPESLLFRIARNHVINIAKRRRWIAGAAPPPEDPDEDSNLPRNHRIENDLYSDNMSNTLIRIHLDDYCDLTDDQEAVFQLLYEERRTNRETGQVLGISQPTLRKVRGQLCEALAPFRCYWPAKEKQEKAA